jgi:hypothetical protein
MDISNVFDHRKKQSRWQPRLATAIRGQFVIALFTALLLVKNAAAQVRSPQAGASQPTERRGSGPIALLVLPSEMPSLASVDVRAAAERALSASDETVIPAAMQTSRLQWLSGVLSADQSQSLLQIAQRVQQGWQSYLRVSLDAALAELDAAVGQAVSLAWNPIARPIFADALVRRGIVAAFVATTEAAKQQAYADVRLALQLDPGRTFNPAEFSPDVIAMINAQQRVQPPLQTVQLLLAWPAATLALPLKERSARIVVDGAEPVTVTDHSTLQMTSGPHLLVVTTQSAAPIAQLINVGADASRTPLSITLRADAVASALAQSITRSMTPSVVAQVWNALRAANLVTQTLTVVASWRRGQPALLGQLCILRTVIGCTTAVEVGWSGNPKELAPAMRSLVDSLRQQQPTTQPISLVTESRVDAPTPIKSRCDWCRNRWLWAGVAAATLTAAGALYAVGQQAPPAPVLVVNPADWR